MAEINVPPPLLATDVELADAVEALEQDLTAETVRATAAESAKYTKPGGGIPSTDLSSAVQASLAAADTAVTDAELTSLAAQVAVKYERPPDGIPQLDLDELTQNKIDAGASGGGLLTQIVDLGDVGGQTLLDLNLGSVFVARVASNTVFEFDNWPTGGTSVQPTVMAVQDSSGHSISFTGVSWLPAGTPPAFMTGPGQVNITDFFSVDNGSTIYGQGGAVSGGGFGIFADGFDGAVVLDGTATYPFLGKSGNFYTMTTRNIYPSNLILTEGVSLQVGQGRSFGVFCQGTINIAEDAYTTAVVGTQASGSTKGSNLATGSYASGADGVDGQTGAGLPGINVAGQSGGFAGRGGNGSAGVGGAPGLATLPTGESLPRMIPHSLLLARMGYQVPAGLTYWPGGASGGSGGGDGTNAGGGGGCGGNPVVLAAREIVNNGIIQSIGGNGGTPTAGNTGGGASGQGGPIALTYGSYTGSGILRTQAGTPGNGHGSGTAGATGGPGWIVQVPN